MAAQDGLTFEGTFNNTTDGLFDTNTTQAIGSVDLRALVTAIRESYLNRIDDVKDEDDMASNSASAVPSQQSVKAYVDALFAIHILDYVSNVDSSGATITLNLNSKVQRMFRSPDSFATPKTIALSNTTNGLVIDFKLIMSDVAAVLSFPTNFTMPTTDLRWNDSAHTFTPSATGEHEFSATFDGTDWDMKATNPFP